MRTVKTYTLSTAVSGEAATPAGLVALEFKAGDVTPANAAEETFLADLVSVGLAKVKPAASAPSKSSTKSAKVEE